MAAIISVIVPVYKVEPHIDRCLNSVVSQTYTDLEIILVDDGSPDRCGEICDEYAKRDSRIRVIHKPNGDYPMHAITELMLQRENILRL